MSVFYKNLDLNKLGELSFYKKITPDESYFTLATINEGYCKESIDSFDSYIIDYYEEIEDYCLKTPFGNYDISFTGLEDFDEYEIECYGISVIKVDNGYNIDYGFFCDYDFNVFKEGGDYDDFYHFNAPLNQYIIDKINKILAKVSNNENQLQNLVKSKEYAFDESVKYEYSIKIKDYYKTHGDMENYKLELENLLFDYIPTFELYLEYRENFPKDCENIREQLFKRYQIFDSFVNKCLYHEKLFDRLANNLESYDELMKYIPLLKDDYPDELLKSCENYLNTLNVSSMKAYKYHKISDILYKMLTIKGSDEIVSKYVKYYRKEFPRRRNLMALLDELNI